MKKISHSLQGIDPVFLIGFSVLVVAGLIILQTASSVASFNDTGNSYFYFTQQLLKGVGPGILLFLIFSWIPYTVWKKLSVVLLIIALTLNVSVMIPGIGVELKGAARWIQIGGVSFQPSEMLKIIMILYLAMILAQYGKQINQWKSLAWIGFIIGVVVGIVVGIQSNLSTALLITMISMSVLFQSPLSWLRMLLITVLGISIAVMFVISEPYRLQRVQTFWEGEHTDSLESGYHVKQNLIAVGSGGLWGVGWNQSRQKFNYVPEAIGDSVFAVYAEESGFVGVGLLLGLFLVLSLRMVQIAYQQKDPFAQYVLIGIVTWFISQIFLNIGSTIKLIPLTGVTLPFVSYGSSSLWVLFMSFGIVANISKYRKEEKISSP